MTYRNPSGACHTWTAFRPGVIALALLLAGALTPAHAVFFPFHIFENSGGVDVTGVDLWLDLTDNGDNTIDFTFGNAGDGVVTRIYFERTDPWESLLAFSAMTFGPGVEFVPGASPANPPGSIATFGDLGPWNGTLFSTQAVNPQPHNGIGAGETLTLQFNYGGDFNTLLDALTDPGEFRIVQKIQDLGPGGEYSVWGATPVPEVPEPATGLLLLAGLAVAARTGLARRRSKA